MKRFNSMAALRKLDNKNNSKTKKRTIIVCVVVLVIGILYFSFARFESTTSFNLISGTANIQSIPLIDKILDLKAKGASDLEFDGVETLGVNGTDDNNLRYVGKTPNNYVYFNCTTTNTSLMNDETCEKWRIVGVFNNIEDEHGIVSSRIKIMRAETIGRYSWNSCDSSINSGNGFNQWGESTYEDGTPYEGAQLMRELNTDYLGNITIGIDGKWYNGSNNSKTADMPESTLNSDAQNMIQTVKWNIGTNGNNGNETWTTKNMYLYERSNNNGKICSSIYPDCKDTVIRTTTWTGKIALIYPSDYGYATSGGTTTNKETCLNTSLYSWNGSKISDCKNNSWILSNNYHWTLTPQGMPYGSNTIFPIGTSGAIDTNYNSYNSYKVRPVLYLQSSIYVTGGNGSSEKPYKLVYKPNIADTLMSLKSNGATDLEYDGTADNNLRYIGANPNNYVEFNGELWRIVGVMNNIEKEDGMTGSLVKIRRAESLGDYSWDSTESTINYGSGINQWGATDTYEGAGLMRELNTDYLGNITVGTDGKWYNGANNSKTASMPSTTLSIDAQSMIQSVKWNLGSPSNNNGAYDSSWTANIKPNTSYTRERANTNGKVCSSGTSCNDTVNRTSTWTGKVGLIYPSDYGYATSGGTTINRATCLTKSMYNWDSSEVTDCKNNDWLLHSSYQWTLSPSAYSSSATSAFRVYSDGWVSHIVASDNSEVFPVVFLQSSNSITEGDGSSTNPYKLATF